MKNHGLFGTSPSDLSIHEIISDGANDCSLCIRIAPIASLSAMLCTFTNKQKMRRAVKFEQLAKEL